MVFVTYRKNKFLATARTISVRAVVAQTRGMLGYVTEQVS